jgi:hypothetical protein
MKCEPHAALASAPYHAGACPTVHPLCDTYCASLLYWHSLHHVMNDAGGVVWNNGATPQLPYPL